MKPICLAVALLFSSLVARADTLTFTLTSTDLTETVIFQLEQGQAPDVAIHECFCSQAVTNSQYLNVPMLVNGAPETGTIFFEDTGATIGAGMQTPALGFWGSVWSGGLASPQFELGTFTSEFECFGIILPHCQNLTPMSTLSITDEPESGTFSYLLIGLVPVFLIGNYRP